MSDNLFIICKICNNSYRNAKSFASYIRNEHKLKIKLHKEVNYVNKMWRRMEKL